MFTENPNKFNIPVNEDLGDGQEILEEQANPFEEGDRKNAENVIGSLTDRLNNVKSEAVQAVQDSQTGEVPAETSATSEQLTAQEEVQAQKAQNFFSKLSKKQWGAIGGMMLLIGGPATYTAMQYMDSPQKANNTQPKTETISEQPTHNYDVKQLTNHYFARIGSFEGIYNFSFGDKYTDQFKTIFGVNDPDGYMMTRFNHFHNMDEGEVKKLLSQHKEDFKKYLTYSRGLSAAGGASEEQFTKLVQMTIDLAIMSDLDSKSTFEQQYINIRPNPELNS